MEKHIWLERWEKGQTGFHNDEVNPLFTQHFKELELPLASRIFVPLCGKTLDIGWLLSKGFSVVGVELSEMAVKALFKDLDEEPYIMEDGEHIHYHAENIDIFVGDFFTLTSEMLGNIDAVYDRAAIVALPKEMRETYTKHMLTLAKGLPQLMTTAVHIDLEFHRSSVSRGIAGSAGSSSGLETRHGTDTGTDTSRAPGDSGVSDYRTNSKSRMVRGH